MADCRQIGAYSEVNRDPRGRTVSVAYLFEVEDVLEVKAQDDAARAAWWPLNALPDLAFDHAIIISDALM